jgi:serine/threonine-protein kinase
MSVPSDQTGYEVLGEVGRGTMGVVYAARDLQLDKEVAIKTPLPDLAAQPAVIERFFRECRCMALMPHPGIPAAHLVSQLSDGRPYLLMQLIKGHTLASLLQERASPWDDLPRFLRMFEQICTTVGYAHSRGVIHRDLEPSNVMVDASAWVRVIDWGLVKWVGGPVGTRRVGAVLGTPGYTAPEQARGENYRHDTRTDVFGLGALLCHILTGQPPYTGSSADEVTRRAAAADLGAAFTRLDACDADGELIALCEQCLAPEMADRPGHGNAVAAALAAYRASLP